MSLLALTLGMPRVASRAAVPKKSGSWREGLGRYLGALRVGSVSDRLWSVPTLFKLRDPSRLRFKLLLLFIVCCGQSTALAAQK